MIIRELTKKDEKKVKELISNILKEIFRSNPCKVELDYDIFYVAEEKENIIGTIALKKVHSYQGRLKRMYVNKKHRRRGLAKKLYNKIMSYCKNNNIKTIYLTTYSQMRGAQRFYQKQGFKSTGKKYKDGRRQFVLKLK